MLARKSRVVFHIDLRVYVGIVGAIKIYSGFIDMKKCKSKALLVLGCWLLVVSCWLLIVERNNESNAETLYLPVEPYPDFFTVSAVKLKLDMDVDSELFSYSHDNVCSIIYDFLNKKEKFKIIKLYGCYDSNDPEVAINDTMFVHVRIIDHKRNNYKQNILNDVVSINVDVRRTIPLRGNFPDNLQNTFIVPITNDKESFDSDFSNALNSVMNNFYKTFYPRRSK